MGRLEHDSLPGWIGGLSTSRIDSKHILAASLPGFAAFLVLDACGLVSCAGSGSRAALGARALAECASAGVIARTLDREGYGETGRGPVGLPGVLYGLVCTED
ncbi:MAG: hypothetical protein CL933_03035 [Deltaproteobacteria bacterium]|nr:hypothetical protein [Deltaproteobacteria bacterium]